MTAPPQGLVECVRVRDARPDEFACVGDLRVAAYRADGFLAESSGYATTLRSLGMDGTGEILAAVDDERILGTVMLLSWPHGGEVVRGAGEAEVRALAVSSDARGRGIGRALLTAVTDRAAQRDVRRLLLLTQTNMHAAQHLYTTAGFCRLPERDYRIGPDATLLAYGLEISAD